MTLGDSVDAVILEGGVDTTTSGVTRDTVIARWNDRYQEMVARSKWKRAEVEIGITVADQGEYSLSSVSDLVDLERIRVEDVPYERIGQTELWELKAGWLGRSGSGGFFAPDYTSGAVDQVELYPAPEDDGDTIYGLCALQATRLSDESHEPIIPIDMHQRIVDGTIAYFLRRVDERLDESQIHEQEFQAGVQELERRRNSKIGSGPVQFRIKGVHF